jgi:transposase-like protein
MPRPSVLTEALTKDFCSKLRISGSIETAIKTTGIGRETYYGWARQVREGGGSAPVRKFMRAVEQAEGEIKLIRELALSKHFDKQWASLAWWLERKFSQEYGQRRPPPIVDEPDKTDERQIDRIVWRPAEKAKLLKLTKVAPVPDPDAAPQSLFKPPVDRVE